MPSEWRSVALSELAEFRSGGTPNKATDSYWGGSIPWVTARDMKSMRLDGVRQSLTNKGAGAVRVVPAGTVLVLVRGMSLFKDLPVVLCDQPVAFNQDIKALVAHDAIDPEYLAFALVARKAEILRFVESAGHGTGRLDTDLLKATPVPVPPRKEQERIAEVLRTWEIATQKSKRIIELRERQYLGLRHELIDWSSGLQQPLSGALKPVSRATPKPEVPYRALSVRSHGKGTFERVVDNPSAVSMDTLYVVRGGDIIVNITFAWEGAIALVPVEHDACLVSHRFPAFVPITSEVNAQYLRHALRMPRFTYLLGVVSPGGAGRNRVLNKRDFLELKVPLPDLDKQIRIAAVLDDAERAIDTEVKYQQLLERQTRGLMQKLLTGEWRVVGSAKKKAGI